MTPKSDAEKYAGWLNKAIDGFQYVFGKYLDTFDLLEDGDFWQIQHFFAHLVFGDSNTQVTATKISGAASDLFKYTATGNKTYENIVRYTLIDAFRFVRTWKKKEETARLLLIRNNFSSLLYIDPLMFTDSGMFLHLSNSLIEDEEHLEEHLSQYGEETYGNEEFWLQLDSVRNNQIVKRLEAAARGAFAAEYRVAHHTPSDAHDGPDIEERPDGGGTD